MEIMHWCLPAQKNRFQLCILNMLLGKIPYRRLGVKLPPFTSDVKNFFQVGKGTWFPILWLKDN